MSDRVKALIVALDRDVHEDDAQALISAVLQLRGVIGVTKSIVNPGDYVAAARERAKLRTAVVELLEALDKRAEG